MNNTTPPRPGFASNAKVLRIIDADTIEVEVKRTVKVRLLGCNVPDDDDVTSAKAFDFVNALIDATDGEVTVFIPAGRHPIRLGDIHSFERILGEIWIDGRNLTDMLVKEHLADKRE